ncbi:CAP domain-containing protein [uncultured Tenacibaculum sp.]|uniref:CAP domain-containing protein n=1 Tax=uncultured Tenacibaculum sp. TaxID=174713 RepID=UPI00262E3ECC|nr:CAP domain-containing protein [uncultured Tenacibaculum sp.]
MKTKLLLLIAIVGNLFYGYTQLSVDEEKYLADLLLKKVNKLRKKKNVNSLKNNINLVKAAKFHSDYMSKKQKLTHNQLETEFVTPKHRVEKFSKEFDVFGENILKTRSIKPPFTKRKLSLMANLMYNSWKRSEGHYKNMISNQFSYSGFGFVYNKKKKQIFATNVFGAKSLKIPNQLSENAFGIGESYDDCTEMLDYHNIIASFGNMLSIEGDEIVFRHHNLQYFKKIFKDKNDGLALDIITKDQLSCNQPNRLDSSPIYDGILLKPIYLEEILTKNDAKSDFRLKISLGKVPSFLIGKDISANLILINNGNRCDYRFPVAIPFSQYTLIPIQPELYIPTINLKTKGTAIVKEIFFDFGSSKIIANNISNIDINKEKVQSIDIKSYTSVDGSFSNNKYLYAKRASFIKNYLLKKLGRINNKINVEAKENWELFNFQLEMYGFQNELNLSRKEKRYFANHQLKSMFKKEFADQRKSKAIVYENGTWLSTDVKHAEYNLIDALLHENKDLANMALVTLFKQKEMNVFLESDFIIDRLIHKKELVQNTAAIFIKNIQFYQLDTVIYYINYWLKRADELSENAKKNLLNLYTITTRQLLMHWDVDNERFARVLHPKKVKTLFKEITKNEKSSSLYLNYHMAIIEYYGQINDYQNVYDSFNYITNYFKEKSLTIEDDIKLALFFNHWSRYDLTLKLLSKSYLEDRLNEEAIFIFAQTLIAYPEGSDEITREAILEGALKLNKQRWCDWINSYFQSLRFSYIKDLYCNHCN